MRLTIGCLVSVMLSSFCWADDVSSLISLVQNDSHWAAPGRDVFRTGVADWNQGRYLSARNNWVRAQGWMDRSGAVAVPAREALASLVAEADRLSTPVEEPEAEPTPEPTPEPVRARKRARRPREALPAPLNANDVMERARVAREAGQTEKALRLMRIASGLPGGEAAGAQADALERELFQPGR